MKRLLTLLLLLSSFCFGQGVNSYQKTIFVATGSGTTIQQNTIILYHQMSWVVTGTPAACTVAVDSSPDGLIWTAGGIIVGQACTSNGSSAVTAGNAVFVRVTVTAFSGGTAPALQLFYKGWTSNPSGGGGTPLWSSIVDPSANLTLSMAGFTTTFNQTSGINWTWANTTAATNVLSQSSPIFNINGKYWDGAASQTDSWTIQNVIANGSNGSSILTFGHTGSTSVLSSLAAPGFKLTGTGPSSASVGNNSLITQPATISNGAMAVYTTNASAAELQLFNNATLNHAFTAGAATGSAVYTYTTQSNGAQWQRGYTSELITLNTAGTTTDSAANMLPAGAILEAVVIRITTTITTAANYTVGDGTTAARFCASSSTLTAGSTQICLQQWQGSVTTDAAGPVQAAAAKLRITTNVNPGAGVIRVTLFYRAFVAPTS